MRSAPLMIGLLGGLLLGSLVLLALPGAPASAEQGVHRHRQEPPTAQARAPFHDDLLGAAQKNQDFRRVLHTGMHAQLVLMSLPPGTGIGAETHARTEQTLVIVSGQGEVILDGKSSPVAAGHVVVVPPGVRHDLRATGQQPVKLYTVYVPPAHLPGRVHRTRHDAEGDTADHDYGE